MVRYCGTPAGKPLRRSRVVSNVDILFGKIFPLYIIIITTIYFDRVLCLRRSRHQLKA